MAEPFEQIQIDDGLNLLMSESQILDEFIDSFAENRLESLAKLCANSDENNNEIANDYFQNQNNFENVSSDFFCNPNNQSVELTELQPFVSYSSTNYVENNKDSQHEWTNPCKTNWSNDLCNVNASNVIQVNSTGLHQSICTHFQMQQFNEILSFDLGALGQTGLQSIQNQVTTRSCSVFMVSTEVTSSNTTENTMNPLVNQSTLLNSFLAQNSSDEIPTIITPFKPTTHVLPAETIAQKYEKNDAQSIEVPTIDGKNNKKSANIRLRKINSSSNEYKLLQKQKENRNKKPSKNILSKSKKKEISCTPQRYSKRIKVQLENNHH